MATIEERKNEAIKRMEALKLDKTCINAFKRVNPGWVNQDMAHYMKSMTKK